MAGREVAGRGIRDIQAGGTGSGRTRRADRVDRARRVGLLGSTKQQSQTRESLMAEYVGAIDQGTTSTRFMVFGHGGNEVARHQVEHEQILPRIGVG